MKVTLRRGIKVIAMVLVFIFFTSTFTVSCGNESVELSASRIMGGVTLKDYGEITKPEPIVGVLLLFPILLMIIWFIKRDKSRISALCSVVVSLIDFIAWIILKKRVEAYAYDNDYEFDTTSNFMANQILLIICIILSLIVLIGIISADKDLVGLLKMLDNDDENKCLNCGKRLQTDSNFCPYCGTNKIEKMKD